MKENRYIFTKAAALCLSFAILLALAPTAFARDSESTRSGTTLYPLYWTAYESCFTADAPLDESRWKENIDWVAQNLLPYGYNMVTTDGWLGGATQTNEHGYLLKYNDNWEHDWQYWQNYCKSKGLDMGVRFLRVDFLCWYETGAGSGGAPEGVPAWGSDNYALALKWISGAAGDDMVVSLAMPNSLHHAANEVSYGDLMRIDTDTTIGNWTWLNG